MPLIPTYVIFILALSSSILSFLKFTKSHNWMDLGLVIPRLLVSFVYLLFTFDKKLDITDTRIWGRDSIAVLFLTEIVYYFLCIFVDLKGKRHAR